nr:hypothetical protein [Pandoravirus belohorizontensis]
MALRKAREATLFFFPFWRRGTMSPTSPFFSHGTRSKSASPPPPRNPPKDTPTDPERTRARAKQKKRIQCWVPPARAIAAVVIRLLSVSFFFFFFFLLSFFSVTHACVFSLLA